MKRLAFVFLLLLAPIVPARAEVLPTFSYQGVLTDPLGAFVPDGLYDITFRLYDAPVAGNLLFTEPHTGPSRVDVRRGHFSVVIGSLVSMHLLDFANPYWLGIQIGADPELTPRVQLTAAPYAIGLKLPFAGTTVPGGPNNLQIANHGNEGTSITLGSENAEMTVALQPDVNGIGGFLQVPSDAIQSNGFYVDGNSNGSGQPAFAAFGSTRLFYYDGSQSGDPAVQVPAGSISAFELGNEPGIAQNHLAEAQINITSTTVMQDVVTVTISTPADGYVVVEASAQHGILGTAPNLMSLQIDQTAGGSVEGGYYFFSGRNYSVAANGLQYAPVSVRRTYFKTAGSHTFRLEARKESAALDHPWLWNPTITAMYVPTSYGGVTTVADQATQDLPTVAVTSGGDNGGVTPAASARIVDLRELELRAERARADAERAQRELLQARLAKQSASAATRPTPRKD